MKLSRPSRFVAAMVALISLLFAQLAVAAYVCPAIEMAQAMEMASLSVAAMDHQLMPDCDQVDQEHPNLCHAHAQAGKQSLDKPDVPHVSPSVAILLVPSIKGLDLSHRVVSLDADASSLAHASAPPLAIRHCCFRI